VNLHVQSTFNFIELIVFTVQNDSVYVTYVICMLPKKLDIVMAEGLVKLQARSNYFIYFFYLYTSIYTSAQIFRKSRSQFKIMGVRKVTYCKVHSKEL
jgi:hypothetical protein